MARRTRDDLNREAADHVEMEAAALEAQGLSPEEARRRAKRTFGNMTRMHEESRAVWHWTWLEQALQDARYAGRLARRQSAFTVGVVLIFALGIGATTTMFSAVRHVLLAPLPFDRPEQLTHVVQTNAARGVDEFSVSLPLYRDWQSRSQSWTDMAATKDGSVTLVGLGDPRQASAQYITPNTLSLLGIIPVAGRPFVAADDVIGARPVVMLSERFWHETFAADLTAIGRLLTIDGKSHSIVGVMPGAYVLAGDADVFLPVTPFDENRRGASSLNVYGRLKPGVTAGQAERDMQRVAAALGRELPDDHAGWSVRVMPLSTALLGERTPRMLYALFAAVCLLLLVACANLSSLLLVRASARRREMAVRVAIGGGRSRIVRQLITEGLWLAALGGVGGVALSFAGTATLRRHAMAAVPRGEDVQVDLWVLAFAAGVTMMSGLLAALAPAQQVSKLDVQRALRESAASVTRGRDRLRASLVIAQLALSIVLLTGAGLMARTLAHLSEVDLGFRPANVISAQVAPRSNPEQFFATLLERLRQLPNVVAVGATSGAPMSDGNTSLHVFPVGDAALPNGESVQADWRVVSAGYFAAMASPLVAGRDISPTDHGRAPKVIVVNQTLARRLWGTVDAVGKKVDLGGGGGAPATVVGVVGDMRGHNPAAAALPTYYVSAYRGIWGPMTLVIRTDHDVDRLLPLVRTEVRALDPTLAVFRVRTMDDLVSAQLRPQRLVATLLGVFALVALTLAVAGIYGLMSFTTGQRVREAALRIALGARRRDVVAPFVREGIWLVLAGAAIGAVIAASSTQLLRGLLTEISPYDPIAFSVAIGMLSSTAALACYIPARRASRVNPVMVLRGE